MMKREEASEDDFVTKTSKAQKKKASRINGAGNGNGHGNGNPEAATSPSPPRDDGREEMTTSRESMSMGTANTGIPGEGISLRPRTMFTVKGRGRTESEGMSAYRPQWSKDGEGFVSNLSGREGDHAGDGRSESARRKGKVLRYSKEELLAMHFISKDPPAALSSDTTVASAQSLPPVNTLPFDYEEIYKQWALNRNRGRGRGRTTSTGGQGDGSQQQRSRNDGRWEDGKWDRTKGNRSGEDSNERWTRGASMSEVDNPNDIWDDVSPGGTESMELDLSSMAAASEKFRQEMDAMRDQERAKARELASVEENDMDAFDKKLEDAAATGQFEDSDGEEAPWEMPLESEDKKPEVAPVHVEPLPVQEQVQETKPISPVQQQPEQPEQQQPVPHIEPDFSFPTLVGDGNGFGLEVQAAPIEVPDEWFYLDPQGMQQGPFKTVEMREWFEAGYFKPHLPIRFGREGTFIPLANHFVQGEIPFAVPPQPRSTGNLGDLLRVNEQQRMMEMHQQQQQQMLQLQQQQEQQRLLQLSQEEKIRLEMQRLEIARQHQSHMFQQQQLLHQQQQQQQQQAMLLQHQSSWQRSHREGGMMNALGVFDSADGEVKDRFRPDVGMPGSFQPSLTPQPQFDMRQAPHPGDPVFNEPGSLDQPLNAWGQRSSPSAFGDMSNQSMFMRDVQQPAAMSPPNVQSQPHHELGGAWGAGKPEVEASSSLRDLLLGATPQEPEQTRVEEPTTPVSPVGSTPEQQHQQAVPPRPESPVAAQPLDQCPVTESPKDERVATPQTSAPVESPSSRKTAWGTVDDDHKKSLKDIQVEEQLQMRKSLEEQGDAPDLARMGAQLKMMLGVSSSAAPPTSAAPASQPAAPPVPVIAKPSRSSPTPAPAPASVTKPKPKPKPAQAPQSAPAPVSAPALAPSGTATHAPTQNAWGAPAAAVVSGSRKKSMREILEEEERLAAERAKRSEATGSHWMSVVAGTAGPSPVVPKASRLGPMPTSVLKSSTRRASASTSTSNPATLAPAPTSSTPSSDNDASFWNFGVAQQMSSSSQPVAVSSFGLGAVPTEFMSWCAKQLKAINGSGDLTLVEYCATLEDPGEIREYLAAYLGSTPRVSAFATEFIQRKKTLPNLKKATSPYADGSANANANANAPESAGGKKSRRRGNKGQKVDPATLLNYSVHG